MSAVSTRRRDTIRLGMGLDAYGWVELLDLGESGWTGVLRIDSLVERRRQLFDCLFQEFPRSGLTVLGERGFPADTSPEFRAELEKHGYGSGVWSAFHVPWARLASIEWGPLTSLPALYIELWWRNPSGEYELKSPSHTPSRLSNDEILSLVRTGGSYEKAQYRYVVRKGLETVALPPGWLCLFAAMRAWAETLGPDRVRLVGFFS
jgi:hypothetical protein